MKLAEINERHKSHTYAFKVWPDWTVHFRVTCPLIFAQYFTIFPIGNNGENAKIKTKDEYRDIQSRKWCSFNHVPFIKYQEQTIETTLNFWLSCYIGVGLLWKCRGIIYAQWSYLTCLEQAHFEKKFKLNLTCLLYCLTSQPLASKSAVISGNYQYWMDNVANS